MTEPAGPHGEQSLAGHRSLPHTADLIIEAWAPTLQQCLTEAVAALTASYADATRATHSAQHRFHLRASSPEQSLVALLEEALYVLDTRGAVVASTHLDLHDDASWSGWFDLADVDDQALVGSVPKGIARSGLEVKQTDGVWRCTATVDV